MFIRRLMGYDMVGDDNRPLNIIRGIAKSGDDITIWLNDEPHTVTPKLNNNGDYEFKLVYRRDITSFRSDGYDDWVGPLFGYDCAELNTLDVSGMDISKLKDMNQLFDCNGSMDELIGYQNWDVSHINSFLATFSHIGMVSNKPGKIDLSGWNAKPIEIDYMFYECGVNSIDLSGWDVSELTNAIDAFEECSATYINFDGWNMPENVNVGGMFNYANNLNHIKCNTSFRDWCWANQDIICLPKNMREGGTGVWELTD